MSRPFARRHIGPGEAQQHEMLEVIGVDSVATLIDQTVPTAIRSRRPLDLPAAMTEHEALAAMAARAGRNQVLRSFIGMGYHDTLTPPVIQRNVFENPGWYTAYTPYQAEISQGRLEALLLFQTLVTELTGMEIANASMLDEATAAAEAMLMAWRSSKSKASTFLLDAHCHPQTLAVVRARAEPVGVEVVVGDPLEFDFASVPVFGALVQMPDTTGRIRDFRRIADGLHGQGALLVVATDLLSLTLITPPGSWGADIVVGNSQRFGVPLGFGGPHAAFFSTRASFQRRMPGRIIGQSIDVDGHPALRMALQTREQHIRRDKATSNICTAQVLLANMAAFYAVWHGPVGLTEIARTIAGRASGLADALRAAGMDVSDAFFDTLHIRTDGGRALVESALTAGFNIRRVDDGVCIALDETVTDAELDALGQGARRGVRRLCRPRHPPDMMRQEPFLQQPVFTSISPRPR